MTSSKCNEYMENIVCIKQDFQLISTAKSISWLIDNTEVSTFDSVSFNGYQRQIDPSHCLGIVNYIKDGFLMPSAVICACDNYSDDVSLRIVDGQHRIEAFRILRKDYSSRFEEIKDFELPVIVLVGAPLEKEIETFITINKTSKKVDTSLAYVLKNKLSVFDGNMAMTRAEYLAVEVARYINETPNKFWVDCILYEGAIKQSNRYISLNSFVRATRIFINSLAKLGLVDINWHSKEDVERLKELIADIIIHIWDCVYRRWPELTDSRLEDKQILQGSIGYTAITRTIVTTSRLYHFANIDDYKAFVESIVMDFRVDYYNWLRGSTFSKYSSETGYKLVSDVLLRKL